MPFTFLLNHIEYKLEFVETSHAALYGGNSSPSLGVHHSKVSTIYIDKTLDAFLMRQTIAHELVHAVGWSKSPIPANMDEEYLCNFIGCHYKEIYELTELAFNYFNNGCKE